MADLATAQDVARLYGRACFGATGYDLDKWVGKPYYDVVAALFPPGPVNSTAGSGRLPLADEPMRLALEKSALDNIGELQRWWLERMRTTPYPLEERMTLFWHDHFATAHTGAPDTADMAIQNQTLRTNALGSFRDLVNAITLDPAMLQWLNGITNRAGGINENYAREFLELFTMGTVPQEYTETDIRQAAKSFSGFGLNTTTKMFGFTDARHDSSPKVVLGRPVGGYPAGDPRNATEYLEITDAALGWKGGETVARFLAYKLVLEFGYAADPAALDADPLVRDVAAAFRYQGLWDINRAVRTMLLHPRWRYPDPGRLLVRSPIEVVVHAAKVLGVYIGLPNGTANAQQGLSAAIRAGQAPFVPPNVGGWPNGVGWLSQVTTLGRYDAMNYLITAYRAQRMNNLKPMPPSADVKYWTWYMGLAGLTPATADRVREYLAAPGTTVEADKQVTLFILMGASPDWQVM